VPPPEETPCVPGEPGCPEPTEPGTPPPEPTEPGTPPPEPTDEEPVPPPEETPCVPGEDPECPPEEVIPPPGETPPTWTTFMPVPTPTGGVPIPTPTNDRPPIPTAAAGRVGVAIEVALAAAGFAALMV